MKNVTANFKNDIRTYGRQFDYKVKINNIDNDIDNFNYIKPSFNIDLFKTVMNKLEIDSKNDIPINSKINIEVGVKVNEPRYEYIGYNTYTVIKPSERQEDTLSYIVKAYDKMVESMIEYDLNITTKIKLRDYLIRVCKRLGWNTKNIPVTFINSEKLVDPTLHIGINYTFRDVLDEIATLSCSFLLFINDKLHMIHFNETNENIDESYLDEDNITIAEKYFINSLVFSRAEESDNIYRKDDKSIELNGLHEYRISDNQLLSTNDRDLYIDEMFNYLETFEFYIFDIKSKGILFLEACDKFNFVLDGKIYPTILLNNETVFEDGLTEDIYTDKPEETETEYKYADITDKRINKAYILVDKQNKKITQLTQETREHEEKITKVEQDVDGIKQTISNKAEYKRNSDGITEVYLEGAEKTDVLKLEVKGNKTYESNLFPSTNLFPSEGLYSNMEGSELL